MNLKNTYKGQFVYSWEIFNMDCIIYHITLLVLKFLGRIVVLWCCRKMLFFLGDRLKYRRRKGRGWKRSRKESGGPCLPCGHSFLLLSLNFIILLVPTMYIEGNAASKSFTYLSSTTYAWEDQKVYFWSTASMLPSVGNTSDRFFTDDKPLIFLSLEQLL